MIVVLILIFLIFIFLIFRGVYITEKCYDRETGLHKCYKCGKVDDPIIHNEGSLFYYCRKHGLN